MCFIQRDFTVEETHFTSSLLFQNSLSRNSLRFRSLCFISQMFDDQDLGFFANFLGIFIFILVIAYHFVMADPKFE
ncbi:putative oligosaccaryltransferase, oligosaccharyltransferase subunit ost4p superfamily [Arabidopsis thaliana]